MHSNPVMNILFVNCCEFNFWQNNFIHTFEFRLNVAHNKLMLCVDIIACKTTELNICLLVHNHLKDDVSETVVFQIQISDFIVAFFKIKQLNLILLNYNSNYHSVI